MYLIKIYKTHAKKEDRKRKEWRDDEERVLKSNVIFIDVISLTVLFDFIVVAFKLFSFFSPLLLLHPNHSVFCCFFFFSSFVTSSKLKRFDFRIKRERNTLILIKVFVYGPGTVPLCRCWYFFSSLVYKRFNTRFFQINKCQECQLFSCFVYIFHFFYFTLLLSLYFNKEQFLPMNKLPLNNCVFFSFWWEAFHKNLCHCCYDKKRKAIQNHFSTLIFDKIDWPLNVTVIPFCSSSSSFFYVLLHISNFHFVCFYGNLHRRFIR